MSIKKHLVIDCRLYGKNYGGIGRYVQEIVFNLIIEKSLKVTILANDDAWEDLKHIGLNTALIKCSSKMFTISEQFELFRKIPSCDVFWSPYMNVPFFPIKAHRRVVTLHDVFHIANPQYYSLFKRIAIWPYYFFSTRISDRIITVSDFSKREIGKFFGKKIENKTVVIKNGCDISPESISSIVKEKSYILFVGSVKPHKNLKNALLAFYEINNKDINFLIVGKKEGFITDDKEVFEIVQMVNKIEERVVFTGNVSDDTLYSYYKNAKILIMPSFYEGFGLPIVEAMIFNIPIACSNIEVFHEIGGSQLFYFDPSSVEDIKKTVIEALQFKEIKYVRTTPSWTSVAQDVLKTLLSVE